MKKIIVNKVPFRHYGMKINERRKEALAQLEEQLKNNTRPFYGSAKVAKEIGLKKVDGKYRTNINPRLKAQKEQQVKVLKSRIV